MQLRGNDKKTGKREGDHAGNEVSVGIISSKARWEKKLRLNIKMSPLGGRAIRDQSRRKGCFS